MGYGVYYEGRAFYPDGATPEPKSADQATAENAATSAAEVAAFKARAADRWLVYVRPLQNARYYGFGVDGELTTWMGDRLATFTWTGPPFKVRAFGGCPSRRRNLRARGIDGRDWYGTAYVSSGDYARIRTRETRPSAAEEE